MKTATAQVKYQVRLEAAIASIQLYLEFGYVTVASTSEAGKTYRVSVNEYLYSTDCQCKAAQNGNDCCHQLATDRYFDGYRPSFHAMRLSSQQSAIPAAEMTAHVDSGLDAAIHEYLNVYELAARTKRVARVSNVCGHAVKHDVNRSCGCDC